MVSGQGEVRLPFQPKTNTQLLSERSFTRRIKVLACREVGDLHYTEDQVAKLSGLGVRQLRTLALYDVLSPTGSGLSYTISSSPAPSGVFPARAPRFSRSSPPRWRSRSGG